MESDAESSNSLDPDITAPESPEHDLDSLNHQPSVTPAPEPPQLDRVLSDNLPAPQLDMYGQPNTDEIEQPQLVRKTRSGRVYLGAISALQPHSI